MRDNKVHISIIVRDLDSNDRLILNTNIAAPILSSIARFASAQNVSCLPFVLYNGKLAAITIFGMKETSLITIGLALFATST